MAKVVITIEDNLDDVIFTSKFDPKVTSGDKVTNAQNMGLFFTAAIKVDCFEEIETLISEKIAKLKENKK